MIGKYEKLDVLGHGASGIVYLAKDTLLNRQVAIKVVNLQAGEVQHFLEEARVLDRLRHPNIVRVHNVDRLDGNIVLDMEYVRGKNVQEMLREQGVLPAEYALEIAAQTLDALQYAHEMQTVHRDIKPANILISREGEVKLVDFGLAEILATNAYAGGAGTYAYMAPEDFAEENHSDHQSDIWAVGVTLYEMLAGQRPYLVSKPKDPFAWKRVLDNERATPLSAYVPDASKELQAVLDRALERDKSRRYSTAAAFRDDVRRLQAGASPGRATRSWEADQTVRRAATAAPAAARPALGLDPTTLTHAGTLAHGAQAETVQRVGPAPISRAPRSGASGAVTAAPGRVDFGSLRQNETREARVQVRARDTRGAVDGRVVERPAWLSVHPEVFDRPKQVLRLEAHGASAGGTGPASATVRVEIGGEATEIPVSLQVIPARPRFGQVAVWFVPLFASTLLPVASLLFSGAGAHASSGALASYVPAAATASGLLAMMLLLVAVAADMGLAERMACGLVSAAMAAVLGASSAHWQTGALNGAVLRTLLTATPIGGMLFLQLLSLRQWRWWALVTACTGLAIGAGFHMQLG
jgi:serine/threonine-protein kinase